MYSSHVHMTLDLPGKFHGNRSKNSG